VEVFFDEEIANELNSVFFDKLTIELWVDIHNNFVLQNFLRQAERSRHSGMTSHFSLVVSLCSVCFLHHLQYFFSFNLFGVLILFRSVK